MMPCRWPGLASKDGVADRSVEQFARDRLAAVRMIATVFTAEPPGGGVDECRHLYDVAIGTVFTLRHSIVSDRERNEAALGVPFQ
jgi:hypothetical protein